jgi:uncharacterized membrane protein
LILWKKHIWSSSICNFLHPPVTSSHLDPYIFLITSFWNIINVCSSLWVTDHVSYSYVVTGKIALYTSNLFLDSKQQETFILDWMVGSIPRI